jgi:hypothetical protein
MKERLCETEESWRASAREKDPNCSVETERHTPLSTIYSPYDNTAPPFSPPPRIVSHLSAFPPPRRRRSVRRRTSTRQGVGAAQRRCCGRFLGLRASGAGRAGGNPVRGSGAPGEGDGARRQRRGEREREGAGGVAAEGGRADLEVGKLQTWSLLDRRLQDSEYVSSSVSVVHE